jgi:hypothetical protein
MKWLSLSFHCNISMKNVCWVHRLWKKADTFRLMLIPYENCVRGICQQIAAAMLHCDDCHLFKWHPTVTRVFWDTILRCHWVSPDSFKESRIPLLGPLKPCRWRHHIPSKHQETLTQWHVTSQKNWILNSTAVRAQTSQCTILVH